MNHQQFIQTLILGVVLTAACCNSALVAQDGMIGFRGDGSGVFPGCTPPTEFDAITGKNLVWKMPLPNFSNSSPIVVGKKVFVVCAAGWPEGQDCAQLLCFDADTGKEIWRKDMDEFATMPEAQAKEAREIRKEYHQRIRRLNNLMHEYQSADEAKKLVILKDASVLGGEKIKRCFDSYYWPCSSAEQHIYNDKVFGDKLKKICAYSPITWSPSCLDVNMPTPVSDGKRIFVYSGRRNVYSFDLDGKLLWQVWQSDAPYNAHWPEDLANAPLIADDLLLMYVFDHLWAYELKTGRLAWKVQSGVIRHGMGTPVFLRLPVPGKPDQFEKMAFLWTGDLIRLRDGRKILADVTKVMFGAMVSDGGQKIYAGAYSSGAVEAKSIKSELKIPLPDKNGSMALEFSLTGPDSATVAQIWSSSEGIGSNPILWKDQLYTFTGGILDARTGRMVSTGKKGNKVGSNGFILAGEHFYGQPEGATSWARYQSVKNFPDSKEVVNVKPLTANAPMTPMPLAPMPGKITDPEQLRKVVSVTGFAYYISDYGWHSPYASPFASGNRLFVRTFDTLFCFGDKNQAFTGGNP